MGSIILTVVGLFAFLVVGLAVPRILSGLIGSYRQWQINQATHQKVLADVRKELAQARQAEAEARLAEAEALNEELKPIPEKLNRVGMLMDDED